MYPVLDRPACCHFAHQWKQRTPCCAPQQRDWQPLSAEMLWVESLSPRVVEQPCRYAFRHGWVAWKLVCHRHLSCQPCRYTLCPAVAGLDLSLQGVPTSSSGPVSEQVLRMLGTGGCVRLLVFAAQCAGEHCLLEDARAAQRLSASVKALWSVRMVGQAGWCLRCDAAVLHAACVHQLRLAFVPEGPPSKVGRRLAEWHSAHVPRALPC
jgi:hypothetical protein